MKLLLSFKLSTISSLRLYGEHYNKNNVFLTLSSPDATLKANSTTQPTAFQWTKTRKKHLSNEEWSLQLWTQFMQLRKQEAWKKFRTSMGFEP